eukprot:242338-Pyramimonas_sp.AAC.1
MGTLLDVHRDRIAVQRVTQAAPERRARRSLLASSVDVQFALFPDTTPEAVAGARSVTQLSELEIETILQTAATVPGASLGTGQVCERNRVGVVRLCAYAVDVSARLYGSSPFASQNGEGPHAPPTHHNAPTQPLERSSFMYGADGAWTTVDLRLGCTIAADC